LGHGQVHRTGRVTVLAGTHALATAVAGAGTTENGRVTVTSAAGLCVQCRRGGPSVPPPVSEVGRIHQASIQSPKTDERLEREAAAPHFVPYLPPSNWMLAVWHQASATQVYKSLENIE
jgi:hypothetical protein